MKASLPLLFVLCFFLSIAVKAQSLEKHRWQHRVLLVYTQTEQDDPLHKQLRSLRWNREGMTERKLIVYQVFPSGYKRDVMEKRPMKEYDEQCSFPNSNKRFEVVLIGLDGTVKERWPYWVQADALFEVIDQMPMRRQELEDGKYKRY